MKMDTMVKQMESDPTLVEAVRKDPIKAMRKAVKDANGAPLQTDVYIYRTIIQCMSLSVLIAVFGSVILTAFGKELPASALALGSAALGAMSPLLKQPESKA